MYSTLTRKGSKQELLGFVLLVLYCVISLRECGVDLD